MKKYSLLALAAASLFAYPMFANEAEESSEDPVAVEVTDENKSPKQRVSFNDEENKDTFIALSDDDEKKSGSYLALSDDEKEEGTTSA